jgi:hypothetical protein
MLIYMLTLYIITTCLCILVVEDKLQDKALGRVLNDCNVPIFNILGSLALQLEMTLWVCVSMIRGVIGCYQ